MAILTLEDQTGSTEVVLFPDAFNNYSTLFKGDEPLLVVGTAEVDDNSSKIIAKEIVSLESMQQKSIRAIELKLHKEKVSRKLLEEIRDIFFKYPGECSVIFKVETGNGKEYIIAAHSRFRVSPCDEMIEEIEDMTGQRVICRFEEWNSNYGRFEG